MPTPGGIQPVVTPTTPYDTVNGGLMRTYHVYIMTNRSGTLYTGVTGGLEHRVLQHKSGADDGFTRRYKIDRLVCHESFDTALEAIAREKQIKGWSRQKKIHLINSVNPRWLDLSEGWDEQALTPASTELELEG